MQNVNAIFVGQHQYIQVIYYWSIYLLYSCYLYWKCPYDQEKKSFLFQIKPTYPQNQCLDIGFPKIALPYEGEIDLKIQPPLLERRTDSPFHIPTEI
jgi:hypothetical protein